MNEPSMVHHMVMQMTFDSSPKVTLLWSWWRTDSYRSYIPSLLALVVVGMLTIYLKTLRLEVDRRMKAGGWKMVVVRGAMSMLSLTLEYLLMLCVMTFNVGVFVSVVAGLGLGVGIFGSRLDSRGYASRIAITGREAELPLTEMATPDYCDCPCATAIHPKYRPAAPSPPRPITDLDPSCCPS
eukprot:Gregarina_sp_Poly_1__6008@NODE_3164_length_1319_cov_78_335463_g2010_i0_p1_GENE_NODE_3164_length_1319_cov_78_335463_g2010_i0NODE_3164_length_1319_cov_78_335463_g2010_i0_p1_ORF_typecomplete_len183_score10_40Ctr/PF04145_15/2_8e20DUF1129/PF06570_11/0_1HisKA_4TM/PF16926_5/0_25_NODE_3164_length_1319_cov_78_335463_g2010_i085633